MAGRIKGITIVIDGETTGLEKALGKVNAQARALQSELRDTERLLKFNPGNADLIAQKQKILASQIENTKNKLNQLRSAQAQVDQQFAAGKIDESQYRGFQREVINTEQRLRDLDSKLKGTSTEFSNSDQTVSKATSHFSHNMGSMKKSADDTSKSLSNLGMHSFNDLMNLGMAGAAVAGFGTAMGAASTAALGFGLKYDASMEQTAKGLTTLTGSADKTKAIMADLQNFAVNTPFDFQGMADGERMLIGFGFAADNATAMLKSTADAVAATGGNSDTLNGVILALGQIQSKGKLSADEMNQLAEHGIPAWKILSKEMGKSPAELMKMAASGKLLSSQALPALQKGFAQLYGGAAAKSANSFTGRLQNLGEVLNKLAGAIAKPLFQPLSDAMGKALIVIQQLTQWFQTLSPAIQNLVLAVMILVPVITILAGLFLTFISFLPMAVSGFTILPAVLSAAAAAFTSIVLPIVGVIAGIAALVAAFIAFYNYNATFRAGVTAIWQAIWVEAMLIWNNIANVIRSVWAAILPFILQIWAQITAFWNQYGSMIVQATINIWNGIVTVITTVLNVIMTVIQTVWPIITAITSGAWNIIKGVIQGALNIIMGVIKVFSGLFTGNWRAVWSGIQQIASGAVGILRSVISGGFNAIRSIIGAVMGVVRGIISSIWNGIRGTISGAVNAARGAVSGAFSAMRNVVGSIMGGIRGVISSGWNAAVGFLRGINLWRIGQNIIQGLVNGIGSMAGAVWNAIKRVAGGIKDKMMSMLGIHSPSRVMAWVGQMTGQGLVNGIAGMAGAVSSAAGQLAQAAVPSIPAVTAPTVNQSVNTAMTQSGTSQPTLGDLVLQITNFNNYSSKDIEQIMNEAAFYYHRRVATT
ncbi:tape measure protein [Sporolactobacillus sp. CQH2019]|uniref:phage tail protein n=1 Tax=Sporolactobacillus sp. CQH2019 TaxID=3023512 RepID=UPI0023675017|nr:tape measure protein [Sporolactobacillus sp. CQH2019]MDD9149262.1 tape measure protein [Sporolactobacillus sp. CQH2019]